MTGTVHITFFWSGFFLATSSKRSRRKISNDVAELVCVEKLPKYVLPPFKFHTLNKTPQISIAPALLLHIQYVPPAFAIVIKVICIWNPSFIDLGCMSSDRENWDFARILGECTGFVLLWRWLHDRWLFAETEEEMTLKLEQKRPRFISPKIMENESFEASLEVTAKKAPEERQG